MFTLCQLVKQSVAESKLGKTFVLTRKAMIITISASEQDYFAPFYKDVIHATQWSSNSCSHCTRLAFVALCFTTQYSVSIASKKSSL